MFKNVIRNVLLLAMDGLWAAELVDGASYIRSRFRISAKYIVEAGCRYGEDSLLLAASYPDAKVMVFECNPETLATTRKNIQLVRNIQLMECALDAEEGEVEFHLAAQASNPGASSLLQILPGKESLAWVGSAGFTTRRVPARRLDTVLRQEGWARVDILWIDVEGAEMRVLHGASEILQATEMVYTEISLRSIRAEQSSFNDIRSLLASYGLHEVRPWLRLVKRVLGATTVNVIFAKDKQVPGR